MRILILGGDALGTHMASVLAGDGHRITVMDTSVERLDALASDPRIDALWTSESLMEDFRSIDISNVDVFLALSDDDTRNGMAAQVASHIFHVPEVVCRIGDPDREKLYREIGLKVVCPTMVLEEAVRSCFDSQQNSTEASG